MNGWAPQAVRFKKKLEIRALAPCPVAEKLFSLDETDTGTDVASRQPSINLTARRCRAGAIIDGADWRLAVGTLRYVPVGFEREISMGEGNCIGKCHYSAPAVVGGDGKVMPCKESQIKLAPGHGELVCWGSCSCDCNALSLCKYFCSIISVHESTKSNPISSLVKNQSITSFGKDVTPFDASTFGGASGGLRTTGCSSTSC